jgi:glucose 1-dehydrogenase
MPTKRFLNKVAIVTGAGSGIGRATSQRLAAEGAQVVVVDVNSEHGNSTVQLIREAQGQALFVHCDVSSATDVEAVIKTTMENYSKIDVIVNDAAIMTFASVVNVSVEQWDKVMGVNLRAAFLFAKFGIPQMKSGVIVNISSVHAFETTANNSPYAASKGGIEAFTRALSREFLPTQVRINAVAPGAVDTPMLWNNPNVKSGKEKISGSVAKPEDIAAAVCFLASDDAKYIHGTTLVVDSGRLDVL